MEGSRMGAPHGASQCTASHSPQSAILQPARVMGFRDRRKESWPCSLTSAIQSEIKAGAKKSTGAAGL